MKLSLVAVPCMALLLAGSTGIASADVIQGSAYYDIATPTSTPPGDPRGGGFAILAPTIGAQLAAAIASSANPLNPITFTSASVNYNAGYGNSFTTLQQFLTSAPGNTTITGGTIPVGQPATGTLLVLTGTVFLTNGQVVTLLHDDGVNLYIGPALGSPDDLLYSDPMQTVASSSQTFTFSGATGFYSAEIIYVTNYEAPQELVSLSSGLFVVPPTPTVPEPSTIALLGTGLLAAAGVLRRRLIS
jgi:PEP-CTERM motif